MRILFAIALIGGLGAPALAQDGKALYDAKCGACHSPDANRIGPKHRGLLGRRIASVPDYQYSAAIKKLDGVWTDARLDQWLQNPQKVAPGNKMYQMVSDPAQRKAIIAYIATLR